MQVGALFATSSDAAGVTSALSEGVTGLAPVLDSLEVTEAVPVAVEVVPGSPSTAALEEDSSAFTTVGGLLCLSAHVVVRGAVAFVAFTCTSAHIGGVIVVFPASVAMDGEIGFLAAVIFLVSSSSKALA